MSSNQCVFLMTASSQHFSGPFAQSYSFLWPKHQQVKRTSNEPQRDRPTDLRVAISMASKSCPELTAVAPAEISSEAGEVIPTGPLYVVWRVSSVEPSGNRYGCIKAGEGRPPSSRGRRGSRQRLIGPIILYVFVWHTMYIYTRED